MDQVHRFEIQILAFKLKVIINSFYQIYEYDTTNADADWVEKCSCLPGAHRFQLQWSSAVYKNYIFLFGGVDGKIHWMDVNEKDSGGGI